MQTCSGKRNTRLSQVCLVEVRGSLDAGLSAAGVAASSKWGGPGLHSSEMVSAERSTGFFSYGGPVTPWRCVIKLSSHPLRSCYNGTKES